MSSSTTGSVPSAAKFAAGRRARLAAFVLVACVAVLALTAFIAKPAASVLVALVAAFLLAAGWFGLALARASRTP